jgi:hypothetical protein
MAFRVFDDYPKRSIPLLIEHFGSPKGLDSNEIHARTLN